MDNADSQTSRARSIQRILWAILFLNLAVAAAKLIYGHLTSSLSMWADGIHSVFDSAANVIGLVGIWAACRPPADCHPYGHRKFETIASLGVGIFLFLACGRILWESATRFIDGDTPIVNTGSFIVMAVTMLVNLGVVAWERRKAREHKSELLTADAHHTQSDLYASIGVIASLIAARAGYPLLDPVVAIVIAGLIGRAGLEILAETSRVFSDSSRIDPEEIEALARRIDGVVDCHQVRTRGTQNEIYVDCHIGVPAEMTAEAAHELVHRIEKKIKSTYAEVADVVIHVEPVRDAVVNLQKP